jgi:hypothetical protein
MRVGTTLGPPQVHRPEPLISFESQPFIASSPQVVPDCYESSMASDRRSQVAVAGRIESGDLILVDGVPTVIVSVKRAAGRKPARGENLHLITAGGQVIRVNSLEGVRVPVASL